MNLMWASLLLVCGLIVLWKCAELLVAGAVKLAELLGISPLVIGLTVVAMGTSAPEVAASIAAAVQGAGDIAIGNVYGSNIANLALVGGLTAIIAPIIIKGRILRGEMPVMLLVALLLWPVLSDSYLSRPQGVLLLTIFAALVVLTVYIAKKEAKNKTEDLLITDNRNKNIATAKKSIIFIVIGLIGLALGANMTLRGAVFIGERVGLSKAVIGLTIIAIGTSLPELITCVVAASKGHNDISIGNLVGSNIFNTLLVTGTAGVIQPFAIAQRLAAGIDYWIMISVSVVFFLMAIIGKRISRTNGILLLCGYVVYMIYLLGCTGKV